MQVCHSVTAASMVGWSVGRLVGGFPGSLARLLALYCLFGVFGCLLMCACVTCVCVCVPVCLCV